MEVVPLRLAEVTYPESHPWYGRPGVVFGYAIRSGHSVILVDTGLGPEHPDIDPFYRPARKDLIATLARTGIRATAVSAIVNTHLHFDHCGGNPRFPGVPIYVQSAEREAARAEGYTVRELVDFAGARYELAGGDFTLEDGIEVLATPGHTPGHQSVVVRGENGPIVLAGHAVGSRLEWERKEPPSENSPTATHSAERLRLLHPAKVYFSHDEVPFESRAR